MQLTTDHLAGLLRKWCTTIESAVDVKTADGYVLRLFVIAFTKKQENQLSRNCYAKQRLVRWIRYRIAKIAKQQFQRVNINAAVKILTRDLLSNTLSRRCNSIVPIRDLRIRKVKVIRSPKFDAQVLLNAHGDIPTSIEADAREVEEVVEAPAVETTAA